MDEQLFGDEALIDAIVAVDRQIAAAEAERARLMAKFVAVRRGAPVPQGKGCRRARVLAGQFAVDEVAAAVCWSTARVQAEVAKVRLLQQSLPRVWGCWVAGDLDGYRVGKIAEAAHRLSDPDHLDTFDEDAAQKAPGKTATQLRAWCNRFVARTAPELAEHRHTRALADRRVESRAQPDGMGSLEVLATAVDTAAIDTRLTTLARGLGAGDPRTLDQRRADIFVDLLLGRSAPHSGDTGAAAVVLTVPIQSLMGLCDAPGELADRSGSVPASLARQIAARPGTLFYRALTDQRGNVLDVTQLGRFPSELLGFAVDIRDGTCRWSTCTGRASGCDANHSPPWPIGRTRAADLTVVCRRHHNGATHAGFTVRQPEPGVVEWTTPTGHTYTVAAEPLPAETWWPTTRETPCPCDACDQPYVTDTDITDALTTHDDLHNLSQDDVHDVADALAA